MEQMGTAERIVSSAIDIFNQDSSASLETIAAASGVTRRTLHRYFKDRNHLLESCITEIQQACRKAMFDIINEPDDPETIIKKMLYAGIDCGTKFTFLHKVHQHPEHQHTQDNTNCREYDELTTRFNLIITKLKTAGKINTELTTGWILALFTGIISATVNAVIAGTIAAKDKKKFAWFSFSKGIGL